MRVFKILLTSFVITLILFINTCCVLAKMPEFSGEENIYIIENNSKDIVTSSNSDEQINSGEINQLMAVLVSLDIIGNNLSDKIIVGEEINDLENIDNLTGFEIDQEVSYQDLLSAILLTGSSDATQILAYNIGSKIKGQSKSDGSDYIASFINKMNEKAKELNLTKTNYSSLFGNEDDITSVEDISILAQNVYTNDTVKKILNSNSYSIKLPVKLETKNSDQSDTSIEDQKENIQESIEVPTIDLNNKFLPILTSGTEFDISSSTEKSNEINDDSMKNNDLENSELEEQELIESEESETVISDETSNNEEKIVEDTNVSSSNKESLKEETKNPSSNSTSKNLKSAFIANDDSNPIIVFESSINDADIIGCITGIDIDTMIGQIGDINKELATNYSFKDIVDESGILGTFKLDNTSTFSKKKIDITANDTLKVFVPSSQNEAVKTKIIWDNNIVNQEGEQYSLLKSIEPGTQVAQLEISKGDIKRLVPLYSSTKANVRNWKDSILTFLFWVILISIPILLLWRIIYVRNRRRALKRRRALRRRKKKLAMKQQKQNQVIESSPIERMAHNL